MSASRVPRKPKPLLDPDAYTIGIVCALANEAIAVQSSFDHFFLDKRECPKTARGDGNSYSFGTICDYHVVLAQLADMGDVEAKEVAKDMHRSFANIKLCLVVGICGIIPKINGEETSLGDVIISQEVIQYTRGKDYPSGFVSKNMLRGASDTVLRGFKQLCTPEPWEYFCGKVNENLGILMEHRSIKTRGFKYPGRETDFLYESDYIHQHREQACELCDATDYCQKAVESSCHHLACSAEKLIPRERLLIEQSQPNSSQFPRVYLGNVASGNKVMKNGAMRDKVAQNQSVIAFEMEGAGVWSTFPTIVIKAGCDYADSHKNKKWQEWAAMTAASCAKAFLGQLQMGIPENVEYYPQDGASIQGPSWRDIFEWLTSKNDDLDFLPFQQDLLRNRQNGTGEWFFDRAEFQHWLSARSGFLYCHGMRGCGKTMLMSRVVDHLQNMTQESQSSMFVIYQYMSPQPAYSCDVRFAALLAQVVQYRQTSSPALKERYTRCQVSNSPPPPVSELAEILLAEVIEYSDIYIVIDGLDSMADQPRSDFVKRICEFGQKRDGVRSLFTSYDDPPSVGPLAQSPVCEIKLSTDDLEKFIRAQMEDKVSIRDLVEEDPGASDEILRTLLRKAEGMWGFLRAYYHLELIDGAGIDTVGELQDFVAELSPDIDKVYDGLWEQIQEQNDADRLIAREVLTWLACSDRDLPLQLIRHVVALFRGDDFVHDDRRLLPVKRLRATCKGLLHIGKASKTVGLKHPKLNSFVLSHLNTLGFDEPHRHISLVCLQQIEYLDAKLPLERYLPGSASNHRQSMAEVLEDMVVRFPLLPYTVENFSYHAQEAGELDLYTPFHLMFISTCQPAFIAMLYHWHFLPEEDRHGFERQSLSQMPVSPLHLATAMNLPRLVEKLLDEGAPVDLEDELGFTALRWSVLTRNPPLMSKLVSKGAALTLEDRHTQTTLRWALARDSGSPQHFYGRTRALDKARIVLGNIIYFTPNFVEGMNLWMRTPRIWTSLDCLELLVDLHSTADLETIDPALMVLAAKKRLGSIVTRLLDKRVKPRANDLSKILNGSSSTFIYKGPTLLGRSRGLMGCLMRVREEDWRHATAQIDMSEDDHWISRLVTSETLNDEGPRARNLLSLAAERGFLNVCNKLMNLGFEVDVYDQDGWTPLMWAVVSPRPLKLFIEDCSVGDQAQAMIGIALVIEGNFQLQENAYSGLRQETRSTQKARIVELLLGHGASPWARNKNGASVFDKARWESLPEVLEVLQRYIRGWTQAYYQLNPDASALTEHDLECGIPAFPARGEYMQASTETARQHFYYPEWPPSLSPQQYPDEAAIEIGNMTTYDKSRLAVSSAWAANINIYDESVGVWDRQLLEINTALPREIRRHVLSPLQLRIENLTLHGEAEVSIGLHTREVASIPPDDDSIWHLFA